MSIELYWDNDERTVMLMEISGAWTWDEMYTTLNKVKKVTDSASSTIGAIIDVSAGSSLPGGSLLSPSAFEHAKRMLKMGEGGTGPVVIVGANSFIRTVYRSFAQMDRRVAGNVQFAETLDEARALLAERMSVPV